MLPPMTIVLPDAAHADAVPLGLERARLEKDELDMAPEEAAGLLWLDALATPLWLLRPDGLTVWLNGAARALIGLEHDAPAAAVRVSLSSRFTAALQQAAAGRTVEARVTIHAPLTLPLEVDLRLVPAPHPSGLILAEAPADSGARQEMMRLNEQLIALSYAYPDIRFELLRDGTILDFAAASPGDLNVPAERFLAHRVQEVLPDPAAGMLAAALGRLNDGQTVIGLDFSLPPPSGSAGAGSAGAGSVGDTKHFEARLVALPDSDRVMCSIRNVTERVQAESAARRAHHLLSDAIECITEGFVLYDAQDRLVLCNGRYRELFSANTDLITPGASFEEVLRGGVERGVYRVPDGDLEGWVERRIAQHRGAGPPMEMELHDGRWIRIEEWRTYEGGTVGIRADITDLKAREAELSAARDEAELANQRKSDYVHHLSHELRTPLNAVLGFAQIIHDEMMGPNNPRYREYAGQIAAAGVYMLDLINNLLDLARIEAGRMDLHEEACNLSLLVDLTFGMMQPRACEAAVALCMEIPEDLPSLHGDASQIRQMLTNLIGNAIKFAPPKDGRVRVCAELTEDGGIALTVADNGIGMRPEQIPVALDAFGQVHGHNPGHNQGRDRVAERGSGLGLPLTRALIALHGGSFHIDSRVGAGTTVCLTFPPCRVGGAARSS
ncbi:signal transduction histidine kinase [Azospirillum sp. OGB3]|uniref:PAS domain-containing sensor histidine kinase n=1 Tax=Azospirillum sp. OGB3 TaxID=2587012 RepID=UPI0017F34522|nr:ATP-binding protein [Azospirillum sp. OGB3]MBB3263145.1 signal transduction histidine kinase [Azospirillum sp. OGB3]